MVDTRKNKTILVHGETYTDSYLGRCQRQTHALEEEDALTSCFSLSNHNQTYRPIPSLTPPPPTKKGLQIRHGIKALTHVYNTCMRRGYIPRDWEEEEETVEHGCHGQLVEDKKATSQPQQG